MKTANLDRHHQIDVTRGRKSTNRAGSSGITFRDAATTVDDVYDLLFLGATVTDGDDGVALVTIGDIAGEPGHTHSDPGELPLASSLLTVDAGTPTYNVAGADVVTTYASDWGYDADGPYYDDAGAAAGEEAILALDPATGELAVVPYNP